jgi:hypothetical protein
MDETAQDVATLASIAQRRAERELAKAQAEAATAEKAKKAASRRGLSARPANGAA